MIKVIYRKFVIDQGPDFTSKNFQFLGLGFSAEHPIYYVIFLEIGSYLINSAPLVQNILLLLSILQTILSFTKLLYNKVKLSFSYFGTVLVDFIGHLRWSWCWSCSCNSYNFPDVLCIVISVMSNFSIGCAALGCLKWKAWLLMISNPMSLSSLLWAFLMLFSTSVIGQFNLPNFCVFKCIWIEFFFYSSLVVLSSGSLLFSVVVTVSADHL